METKKGQNSQRNRFQKLSLKRNKLQNQNCNSNSEVILLDESLEVLSAMPDKINGMLKMYSPIVINDTSESSSDEGFTNVITGNDPDTKGYVSLNSSLDISVLNNKSKPSVGGWSPAQNIICATPKYVTTPSTPKDTLNVSSKECSMKKIQQSQKKILDELYGETWKSIPKLFKTISKKLDDFNLVSKKLKYDDEDSDKENLRYNLAENKKLYLTGSDAKRKVVDYGNTDKKSKKKLYTEKVPNTPEPPRLKPFKDNKGASTSIKKLKGKSVTELVRIMETKSLGDSVQKDVDSSRINNVETLSFLGSLEDNVPTWRQHPEVIPYIDNFKKNRDQLTRRLFVEYNRFVFEDRLDADMPLIWDAKLRSTAGTTTSRLIKTTKGQLIRSCTVKLSVKVLDTPQRLRNTLIHELCHAACWLIDGNLRAGHGPLWKKWVKRALQVFPELIEIPRCHSMPITHKYIYKCEQCGTIFQRHSKSIDITRKTCGNCRGFLKIMVQKKNKDGLIVHTPARKGTANDFALYVKNNYGTLKNGVRTHGQIMKLLGEQFTAQKNKINSESALT